MEDLSKTPYWRRPTIGRKSTKDRSKVFYLEKTRQNLSTIICLPKTCQRSPVYKRPVNNLLATEELSKIFCLQQICYKSSVYGRHVKDVLSEEDQPKILCLQKVQHRSFAYRRTVKSFVFIGPVEVLFPIKGLSKLFSLQKIFSRFLILTETLQMPSVWEKKNLAKFVCPKKKNHHWHMSMNLCP